MSYFPELPEFIVNLFKIFAPLMTNEEIHFRFWQLFRILIFPGLLFAVIMVWPNVWIERKMWGRIHDRRGPTHVGFRGFLQLMADFIKLLSKETIIPKKAHKLMFRAIPILSLIFALTAFSLLPFDENWALYYSIDDGVKNYFSYDLILLYALLTGIPVMGLLAGWAAGSKYPIIGGWRYANQQFAVEIPLLLSTVGPALLTGSLSLMYISLKQADTIWFVFILPLTFITFVTAGIASVGRWPFDIEDADSEIVVGWRTEYGGSLFMIVFMAQYIEIFLFCGTAVALWLGGGQIIPFVSNATILGRFAKYIPPAFIFIGKMLLVYLLFIIVTNSLHRIRMDQILKLMWRILIPLTLINILGAMLGLALFPGFFEYLGLI
ncbi:MAG: NADH-quinone oxidoreductase subunit H [Candidatus Heimdallarchaeota archaeon]